MIFCFSMTLTKKEIFKLLLHLTKVPKCRRDMPYNIYPKKQN